MFRQLIISQITLHGWPNVVLYVGPTLAQRHFVRRPNVGPTTFILRWPNVDPTSNQRSSNHFLLYFPRLCTIDSFNLLKLLFIIIIWGRDGFGTSSLLKPGKLLSYQPYFSQG